MMKGVSFSHLAEMLEDNFLLKLRRRKYYTPFIISRFQLRNVPACMIISFNIYHHIYYYFNNIGGRNDFVDLKIRSINDGSVVVNCSFLDLNDISRKSCSISYGPIKGMLIWSANGSSNSSFISLSLNGNFQDKTELFYVVTASNSSFTLKVEGTLNLGKIHQGLIESKGVRACNSHNYIIAPCMHTCQNSNQKVCM